MDPPHIAGEKYTAKITVADCLIRAEERDCNMGENSTTDAYCVARG